MKRKLIIPEANLPANYKKLRRSRIGAAIMAGVLSLSMVLPASAAKITVNGTGESFKAYKLLTLTTSLKKDDPCGGSSHTDECYNYAYSVNPTYKSDLIAVLNEMGDPLSSGTNEYDTDNDDTLSDKEIIAALESMTDSETIRTFADNMFAELSGKNADETSDGKVFEDVKQGYYLIYEDGDVPVGEARSLVLLDTARQDDINVDLKEGAPSLTKKVIENSTSEEGSHADAYINDDVKFKLTATLPDSLDGYDDYKLVFHDKLAAALSLNEASIKVTVDGTPLSVDTGDNKGYTVNSSPAGGDGDTGCSFEVTLPDALTAGAHEGSVIIVEYTAKLNKDSVVYGNEGNDNTAHLEYRNDPYTTDMGTTTPSTVTVFTFKLTINKVDESKKALEGAGFTLYKKGESPDEWTEVKEWNLQTQGGSTFEFDGLDAGEYKLSESKVPDGYHPAEDIYFKVVPKYTETGVEGESIESLDVQVKNEGGAYESKSGAVSSGSDFEIDANFGSISASIENIPGTKLPSTGGVGAYVVYISSAAAIGGAAFLIARKKKNEAED